MTDRARELLERVMEALDGGPLYRLRLKEEIRAYLAEPEVKREPIGQGDYVLGEGSEYFDTAPRPEPEPEQEQERLDLIGELHPNGLVDFVNDEIPIHHVFPVKLYAKGEALINEIAKCNSDILLGKDHPAPRPEFVKLSEEEIMEIVRSDDEFDEMMWDCTSIRFARAIEDALEEKNK